MTVTPFSWNKTHPTHGDAGATTFCTIIEELPLHVIRELHGTPPFADIFRKHVDSAISSARCSGLCRQKVDEALAMRPSARATPQAVTKRAARIARYQIAQLQE